MKTTKWTEEETVEAGTSASPLNRQLVVHRAQSIPVAGLFNLFAYYPASLTESFSR